MPAGTIVEPISVVAQIGNRRLLQDGNGITATASLTTTAQMPATADPKAALQAVTGLQAALDSALTVSARMHPASTRCCAHARAGSRWLASIHVGCIVHGFLYGKCAHSGDRAGGGQFRPSCSLVCFRSRRRPPARAAVRCGAFVRCAWGSSALQSCCRNLQTCHTVRIAIASASIQNHPTPSRFHVTAAHA